MNILSSWGLKKQIYSLIFELTTNKLGSTLEFMTTIMTVNIEFISILF